MPALPASAYGPCGRTPAVRVASAPSVHCGMANRSGRAVRSVVCSDSAHLAVGSFNVLCPLYNQTDDGCLEETQPAVYTPRLRDVAHEIVAMSADVVCLQVAARAS